MLDAPETDPTPTLLVTIDGLRAAALGAYGQTGYETPGFDTLAAGALTLDWCYTPTPDTGDWVERLLTASGPLASASVVTDDPEAFGGRAPALTAVTPPTPADLAESIDGTTAAAVWSVFAESVVAWSADPGAPLWLHTRGLRGPWDAPAALAAPLRDEDDPEVECSVTPPDIAGDDASPLDADAQFAAACRYAAQVMALDACLAGWLDVLAGLMEGEDYRLLLAGAGGFPLGEHGRVGGVDRRLFSEQHHVPLLAVTPDPASRFTRAGDPITLDTAIRRLLAPEPLASDSARLTSEGVEGIVTPEWMLRSPADSPAELYVKPDDRWEQNDIAKLEEAAADHLLALLSPGEGGLAESAVADPGEDS